MERIKVEIEADSSLNVTIFDSVSVSVYGEWHYPYNETEWSKQSATCEYGTMQSPIDLRGHPGVKQDEISTTRGLTSNLEASHKHSLQWNLITENYPTLHLKGLTYELKQWHCHTGSEHTVDGYQYPGECHFVHVNGSQLAVIGVFL